MPRSVLVSLALAASLAVNALAALALAGGLLGQSPAPAADAARRGTKAFARVTLDGSNNPELDERRSHNVKQVSRESAGVYCLDLSVPVKTVVASVSFDDVVGFATTALVTPDIDVTCPADHEVVVSTIDGSTATPADRAFYVFMH